MTATVRGFREFDGPARALLREMTLEEKAGQMCQPDQSFLRDPREATRWRLGSVLSGGGSGPKEAQRYNLGGWTDMVDSYQRAALESRLGIPLLYGVDAVHGHNNVPGAVIFPHQIGLGCTRDPELVEQIARETAIETRATGINWVFAPCVAVPQDPRWGRTYEGFSSDPELVAELGAAVVRGLQGESLSNPLSVAACAKHFIADGGTLFGTAKEQFERGVDGGIDQGDARCAEAELRRIHLPPYRAAVAAGVATVMPSYSSWNGVKCSAHRWLLTDLLKRELGFEGFVISDYDAIDQIDPDYRVCIRTAIDAGIDMVMLTNKYPIFCELVPEMVRSGELSAERVNDAVSRILRVKFALGLLDRNRPPFADRALHADFGSPRRRAIAREAVRKSLVMLKNENGAVPLDGSVKRIHVVGEGAESVGMQCGGWTIDWRGSKRHRIPGGTSLLEAIRAAAPAETTVTYSADARAVVDADAVIAVVGEEPYAEFFGDTPDLSSSITDQELVERAARCAPRVIVVVYSGRPLELGKAFDLATAVIAAWLPGSEGAGIAEILFGLEKPSGVLSRPWAV